MSGSKQTFPELPGWLFKVEEISAGVYRVNGVDELGRSVDVMGTDPEALLQDCKLYAIKVSIKGLRKID